MSSTILCAVLNMAGSLIHSILCRFTSARNYFQTVLESSSKDKGVHLMHIIGRAILADGVNLGYIFLRFRQVRTDIVLACFNRKIFKFSIFILVIDHKLCIDYVQQHLEKMTPHSMPSISNSFSIHELLIVKLKLGVTSSFHVVFEDELDGVSELLKLNLLLVDEETFPRYIWVNGIDIHVHGCG